ncbi:tryptophan halogenase family protein [Paraferrimonas haliotis]|uniref:tryptophan halogenase family protein n=1 Tax=Paraferrimonas haliotis TaxID=2013866 RepID=UPI000BA9557C|nr:tryptophan halogenase family protein [Paraferrimonas haliotis]
MKKLIVLGGGTAGWMAVSLLRARLPKSIDISIIDSSTLPSIGVGEGSTPILKTLFDNLGVSESEWMPKCNATYKLGIQFEHWSIHPGYQSYFNPFYSPFDPDHAKALVYHSRLRRGGYQVDCLPDKYCFSAYLAKKQLSPLPPINFPFEPLYGYHFDASLLAKFLMERAKREGVTHVDVQIERVLTCEQRGIESLIDSQGNPHKADFYVDCSGFQSMLLQQALNVPFQSYEDVLFNDAAVTLSLPAMAPMPCQTVSTALSCGWAWQIPLQSRTGVGYVYSSRHLNADQAAAELAAHVGLNDQQLQEVKPKSVAMKVGRVEKHWHKNVLAIGLSQGFIEPLEATGLALTQQAVNRFIDYLKQGRLNDQNKDDYNRQTNASFDSVKDFIHTHYLTNSRNDSDYWQQARASISKASPKLQAVLEAWNNNQDIEPILNQQDMTRFYSANSWHYLLCGVGFFSQFNELQPPPAQAAAVDISRFERFFNRCAMNYPPHQQTLQTLEQQ